MPKRKRPIMTPAKAELVERCLDVSAGSMRPIAWAAFHAAASPYDFDYWLTQAWARAGLDDDVRWNINADVERQARIDAWVAQKWADQRAKKGKKK